ncbi:hypothetical protein FOA43_001056 [Brettanomyces nanus]|uniref:Uncharacterized protein n=1 Tax=Eeniella nana TaxID=13502 RepID=A0A875RYN1_EENNA|nr:uncharacterized protein FOA43_001056 [Brettanomyces nanus]QPG73743.1 hypothetical protein FOA43_001056 [Brettanomyces nanus]
MATEASEASAEIPCDSKASEDPEKSKESSANREISETSETPLKHELSAPSLPAQKKLKTESPTPQPIPQLKLEPSTAHDVKINRPVEEIIDGSELRRFLNKNLTRFLIRGLNQLAETWENGQLDDLSTKAVLLEFSDILRKYAQEN